jgi:hypothetical protein
MNQTVTRAEAARLLGVNPSTITRMCQEKRLKSDRAGRIPVGEVERVRAAYAAYTTRHATRLEALDLLVTQIGGRHGATIREAVEIARELVKAADGWNERANRGASAAANDELTETVRRRIAAVALLHEELVGLEGNLALAGELIPREPRQQLFELAVRRGGMTPERAREAIDQMDDETVASKLAEWPTLAQSEPAEHATPATGEEQHA